MLAFIINNDKFVVSNNSDADFYGTIIFSHDRNIVLNLSKVYINKNSTIEFKPKDNLKPGTYFLTYDFNNKTKQVHYEYKLSINHVLHKITDDKLYLYNPYQNKEVSFSLKIMYWNHPKETFDIKLLPGDNGEFKLSGDPVEIFLDGRKLIPLYE